MRCSALPFITMLFSAPSWSPASRLLVRGAARRPKTARGPVRYKGIVLRVAHHSNLVLKMDAGGGWGPGDAVRVRRQRRT
jgi:hypothetical protein